MMASGDIRCDIVGICSYEIITGWDIYIGDVLFYIDSKCSYKQWVCVPVC